MVSPGTVQAEVLLPGRQDGGVTVSTGSDAAERHAGVWAPVIAYKNTIANNNLALAA